MLTPHQLPPAHFDCQIAAIHDYLAVLATANTPILSLCGGVDLMVPSESCILPDAVNIGDSIDEPSSATLLKGAGQVSATWL